MVSIPTNIQEKDLWSVFYNAKIYDKTGIFKKQIDNINSLQFSAEKNKWLWDIKIELDLPFTNTDFIQWDIIEIKLYNDDNKNGINIYAGVLQEPIRIANTNRESVNIDALWLYSVLSGIKYNNSGYSFTKNDTAKNILTEIINNVNTTLSRSPPASYSGFIWSTMFKIDIPDNWPTLSLNFDYTNSFEAIKDVINKAWWFFFIKSDGTLIAKEKPSVSTYSLTYKKDVQEITTQGERVINRIRVERSDGTIKEYSDSWSIALYWESHWNKIVKSDINNEATQDEFASTYLSENAYPRPEINIKVNKEYNYFDIIPWETVRILNIDYSISNVEVQRISFNEQQATLNLNKYESLGDLIVW